MATDSPRSPLFVLRQHRSAVLCCSFYPVHLTQCDAGAAEDGQQEGFPTWRVLFLSGDADGVCILWDLSIRKPLLSFVPAAAAQGEAAASDNGAAASSVVENRGILSVGFFPSHAPRSPEPGREQAKEAQGSGATTAHYHQGNEPSAVAVDKNDRSSRSIGSGVGLPFKFSLRRRHNDRGRAQVSATPAAANIYFYTQCRNRKVYVWKWCGYGGAIGESTGEAGGAKPHHTEDDATEQVLPSSYHPGSYHPGLTLLHTLDATQYGFCKVACAYHRTPARTSSYFVTPHDSTDGRVDLWAAESSSASSSSGESCFQLHRAGGRSSAMRLAEAFKGGMIMYLHMCCNASTLAAAFESGHVALYQYRVEGGGDSDDDCPASESKRFCCRLIALIRAFAETCTSCFWEPQSAVPSSPASGDGVSRSECVVAASADGVIHCYLCQTDCLSSVAPAPDEEPNSSALSVAQWRLAWESNLSKGIGHVTGRGGVLVIGGWDATVRLLEKSTGRVLTILPHHTATVNAVAQFNPVENHLFLSTTFDFNAGKMRSAEHAKAEEEEQQQQQNEEKASAAAAVDGVINSRHSSSSKPMKKGEMIYVFASASKDHSVAIWKIDFLLERFSTKPQQSD